MANTDQVLLLQAENLPDHDELPPYVESLESAGSRPQVPVSNISGGDLAIIPPPPPSTSAPPYSPSDLPPVYSSSTKDGEQSVVICKVCQNLIDVSSRLDQLAVRCDKCHELTPAKDAPPGKKYIRCVCNCLLVCNQDAVRVRCPRATCQHVTVVNTPVISVALTRRIPIMAVGMRYSCGHCHGEFFFNKTNILARCPHCNRISSPGAQYAKKRASVYISVGALCIVIGIVLIVSTYIAARNYGGYYSIYIGSFIVGLLNILRGLHFACMTVSHPVTLNNTNSNNTIRNNTEPELINGANLSNVTST